MLSEEERKILWLIMELNARLRNTWMPNCPYFDIDVTDLTYKGYTLHDQVMERLNLCLFGEKKYIVTKIKRRNREIYLRFRLENSSAS